MIHFIKITLVFFIIFTSLPSNAALSSHMEVTGDISGNIIGDVTQAGREGTFIVHEFHHLLNTNEHNHLEHKPLIVTTTLSQSIPVLLNAMNTGETLNVMLRFYRPTNTGQEINHYSMELKNALIQVAEPIMLNNLESENANSPTLIRLRFIYQEIIHYYHPEGQTVRLQVTMPN